MTRVNARRLDARPRRKPKIPRNAARRAGATHSPIQVERYLAAALARMTARFAAEVRRIVLPKVDSFARWPKGFRADAEDDDEDDEPENPPKDDEENERAARVLAGQMRSAASRSFQQQAIRSVAEQAARRVQSHSKDSFKQLGIKVAKEPELKWLVDGWAKDVAGRVKGATDDQVDKLAAILATGGARHAESISQDIQDQLGVTADRADFIARDSVGSLNAKVTRHRQEAAGIEQYVWTTVGDARVRDEHAELDGELFDVDGDGDPDEGHPGEPPNCFPGSTPLVRANLVERAFRHWYRGQLTTIVTNTGVTFESTPNHPVLTARGWVPCHSVDVGDHVFEVRDQVVDVSEVNVEHRQPAIADVFDALAVFRRAVLPGTALQFHGDGSDEDVDVVEVDRRLLLHDDPASAKRLREFVFSEAFERVQSSARGRSLALALERVGLPATRIVRSFGERLALLERHVIHAREHGCASPAYRDVGAAEEVRESLALTPVLLSERLDRGAFPIEIETLLLREAWLMLERSTTRNAAPSAEELLEAVSLHAESPSDLSNRQHLIEHPLRVVEKRFGVFGRHRVYNLQTDVGWYATTLLNSNCRCVAWPLPPEKGDDDDSDESDE